MGLTSLQNLKAWANATTATDDAIFARLINQSSQRILSFINRPNLGLTTFTETMSGRGTRWISLRNYPVVSIISLTVDTVVIPQSPGVGQYGWTLTPFDGYQIGRQQELSIDGYVSNWPRGNNNGYGYRGGYMPMDGNHDKAFPRGLNNITTVYTAGYCVQNEAQTIPASPFQLNPLTPTGVFNGDNGVTYATTGVAFTKVASVPAQGQYSLSVNATSGIATYTFNSADTNASVLLNYNYVPFDLEQCCIDLAMELYKYRDRIGQTSKTVGGQETTSYTNKMPPHILEVLNNYKTWGFTT